MNVGARFCGRGRLADQRGQEDEHEQAGRERRRARRGAPSSGAPARARRGAAARAARRSSCGRFQSAPSARNESDEDDRAAPEEEPVGNRQVLDAADPVREQAQGRTSSSAIWRPRSSSSISNRPGASAVKRIVAGCAGRDVRHQVVAVDDGRVGDVRGDDEHDLRSAAESDGVASRSRPAARRRRSTSSIADGRRAPGSVVGRRRRRRRLLASSSSAAPRSSARGRRGRSSSRGRRRRHRDAARRRG